jgi:hypothetical protein
LIGHAALDCPILARGNKLIATASCEGLLTVRPTLVSIYPIPTIILVFVIPIG